MFDQLKEAHQKVIEAAHQVAVAEVKLNEVDLEFDNHLVKLNEEVEKFVTLESGMKVEFTTMFPDRHFRPVVQTPAATLFIIIRRIDERFVHTHPCVESYQSMPLTDAEKDVIRKTLEFLQTNGLSVQEDFYSTGNTNIYQLRTGN